MPCESVVVVEVSSTSMVPVLSMLLVCPPSARMPVTLFRFWNSRVPLLETVLSLSTVTAAPDVGFTETPALMTRLPDVEVASGVVVLDETVVLAVWASAGAAQISAERLTSGGPNRRI